MPLPKIDQPLFELEIPSSGEKVKYRPFTVKEEKILLIAQESKDIDQIVLSIKQIIGNCLVDHDISKLSVFDIEYILLNIRAKAVNNMVTFNIKDPDTDELVELTVDINEVKVEKKENHSKIIDINESIKMKMKYPSIEMIKDIIKPDESGNITSNTSTEDMFDVMVKCIESVVEEETVYKLEDFTEEEVQEFIDSLNGDVLQKIKSFFDTMPVMRFEKKYKNKNGDEKTFVAEGTETFFI